MGYYDSEFQGEEVDDLVWLKKPNPMRFWFTDNILYNYKKDNKKKMAANDSTTVFVRGKIYWPKIIGAPRPNYDGDAREWTYDFVPYDTTFLKEHKLLDRLKAPTDTIPEPYLRLKKPELNYEGEKNPPIRILDIEQEPWDDNKLLGNGTEVDLKLRIVDWGKGKKSSIYTTAIRVRELVPYTANEFGAMDSSESGKAEPRKKSPKPKTVLEELDDLDDDVPF